MSGKISGNMYARNIRRTIFGSLGRYIAIFAIVALGVGFFAGVKDTKASMMLTCNEYVDESALYDCRLVSTYGFTDDDVKAVADEETVSVAEGAVTADFFSQDRTGNSIILRAHSITEDVNKVDLISGRMPESDDECVADKHFFSKKDIGRTLKVTGENDKETRDALTYDEYKIVGIAQSPYYIMKTERGTTSLGSGTVDAFIYAPQGAFTSEYYTELLVLSKEQGFIFSDEYYDNIEKTEDDVTKAAEDRAEERFDEIKADAREEIEKGQKELDDGRATLEAERESAYAKLDSSKKTLDESSSQIEDGKAQLVSQRKTLNSQRSQVVSGISQIESQLPALEEQLAQLKQLAGAGQDEPGQGGEGGQGSIEQQIQQLEQAIAQLKAQRSQLEGNLSQIDGGLAQIAEEEKKLSEAEKQLEDGYAQYEEGKAEADSQFAEAEAELQEGQKELDDAEKELADLKAPVIYVYDREDNTGFGSFESNADIVDSIAKIFPVFFFLIAALVCSTTMSRMIDEERTQLGALSALGYTSGKIMMKYMIYSGSAALLGCAVGFLAGSKYFPYFIWIAYGMMFGFAPLEFYFDWQLALISLAVSLLCSSGTTYLACREQLKHMPAEILRPKAPKAGKRIFLERISFIWKAHEISAQGFCQEYIQIQEENGDDDTGHRRLYSACFSRIRAQRLGCRYRRSSVYGDRQISDDGGVRGA